MIIQIIFIFLLLITTVQAAPEEYNFSCKDSKVSGSIKYGVIGAYKARFKECRGQLTYDPKSRLVSFVEIKIKVNSLVSNCDWCNKIVLSPRVLDAASYPWIYFKSSSFQQTDDGPMVAGELNLHGKTKKIQFPYVYSRNKENLNIKGKWSVKRKEFNINWNKLLDHGGVMVGDYIIVDWDIVAERKT